MKTPIDTDLEIETSHFGGFFDLSKVCLETKMFVLIEVHINICEVIDQQESSVVLWVWIHFCYRRTNKILHYQVTSWIDFKKIASSFFLKTNYREMSLHVFTYEYINSGGMLKSLEANNLKQEDGKKHINIGRYDQQLFWYTKFKWDFSEIFLERFLRRNTIQIHQF